MISRFKKGDSVLVKHGVKEYPLCDPEVEDTGNINYQLIGDYRMWFANR